MRAFVAVSALALPFMTWIKYGEQVTVWDTGFIGPPLWGITVIGLVLTALTIVVPWNRIIGGFCAYAALAATWSAPYALSIAIWIGLGGVVAAHLSAVDSRLLRGLLVTLGLIQVAILLYQFFGWRLRFGDWGLPFPHGTYGNPRYVGMALAMIVPMAPLLVIPAFVVGLLLTKSYIAIIAAVVTLGVRYRKQWMVFTPFALGTFAVAYLLRGASTDTLGSRFFIERATLLDWWHGPWTANLFGYGLGAWLQRMYTTDFHGELYLAPYNDYLQLLYEMGLVGVGFLVAFVIWHWQWFLREPALCAVAILAFVWFPFHLTTVAVVALGVIGRASTCGLTHLVGSTESSGQRSYSRLWWEATV